METKQIFFILSSVWFLDYLTTFIGIHFIGKIVETNPIPKHFFSAGIEASIVYLLLSLFLISIFSLGISKIHKFFIKDGKIHHAKLSLWLGIGFYSILEVLAIINNLLVLESVIFT